MRGLIAAASVAALLLAGCTSSNDPAVDEVPEGLDELDLAPTATTGIIRGVVVDEAVRPIAGATITLRGEVQDEAVSTDTGVFGFDDLPAGTYFLSVRKVGYVDVQQSAEVVAGVAEPPIVKVLLAADVAGIPYHVSLQWEGFVECGTDALAVCAVPDFANQTACDAAGVCPGKITNDDFDQWHFIEGPPQYLQAEMVWESTQSVSQTFSLLLRAAEKEQFDTGFYEFSIDSVEGPSPLILGVGEEDLEDAEVGNRTGLITAVFSGAAEGNPAGIGGFVVNQRFTVYINVFYGYTPPEGWSFVETGTVPPPA